MKTIKYKEVTIRSFRVKKENLYQIVISGSADEPITYDMMLVELRELFGERKNVLDNMLKIGKASDQKTEKIKGSACISCGRRNAYYVPHLGMSAPNRQCRSCGKEWIEVSSVLHVSKSGDVGIGS